MLVQVDLSQAELRVMAVLSGDPWMIAALQEDQGDFFDEHMMPVCFPGTTADILSDPVMKKELRVKVKTVQYGLAFGRKAGAIATELGLPRSQAQKIIDNYLARASKFSSWRAAVEVAAVTPELRDMLVTPFGRVYQSEIVTAKNEWKIKNEALSFLPQSTASDICLSTAIRIHETIKEMGGHIVCLVHDAIIVEVIHESSTKEQLIAHQIGQYIQQEFRETGRLIFGDVVPFLSEYSIGDSWADLL